VRQSLSIAAITSGPPVPRNVLFILTESVRADAFCSEFSADCRLSPHTNRALPERVGFRQLRALDSTTAISLPVLWSGVGPHESRDVLHTWPLLFDYAEAAGWSTAYWTSQNPLFANARLYIKNLGADQVISGTQLDGNADIDMGAEERLLVDHALQQLPTLREPFFALLHTSGTHYPYRVDPRLEQPFQPAAFDKGAEATAEFKNYYQNAIVQQDAQLERLIRELRKTPQGQRTVIVLTSDHGEAFRDHGQLGHTFSLFDEEIHVPGFVDAPANTLTAEERAQLEAQRAEFLYHPDLTATTLDLMGVWDTPQVAPFRSRILGSSLLRPIAQDRAMPLTNCAALWSCAFENWGAMQGRYKLFARTPYDQGWQCYDVLADPREATSLQSPQCDALRERTLQWFLRPPI
jgi:arylsulfatase A-like enzyme